MLLSLSMSFVAFSQDDEGGTPCACPPAADRSVVIVTDNGGLGTVIISTSRGLLSDSEARKRKLGGELICEVWS